MHFFIWSSHSSSRPRVEGHARVESSKSELSLNLITLLTKPPNDTIQYKARVKIELRKQPNCRKQ